MKKLFVFLALAVMITALTGCSVTTKMVTRERVDQNLSSSAGNQGYLMGTPPAVGERKPTKTYIEVQVEAPAIEKENRRASDLTMELKLKEASMINRIFKKGEIKKLKVKIIKKKGKTENLKTKKDKYVSLAGRLNSMAIPPAPSKQ